MLYKTGPSILIIVNWYPSTLSYRKTITLDSFLEKTGDIPYISIDRGSVDTFL